MTSADLFGHDPLGATPLSPDDYVDLIPMWVSRRADLNQAEAANISDAQDLFFARRLSLTTILDDLFVRKLHMNMYGDVWTWAGRYRTRDLSIGVPFTQVAVEVNNLMKDSSFWLKTTDAQELDQAICRVHHRLVAVHPFINGNGRMCRMYADLIALSLGRPLFSWGGTKLGKDSETRLAYISALKSADSGDFQPLYSFVRSTQQ
jgi:Fic-DOC domain mobile mystery protein B